MTFQTVPKGSYGQKMPPFTKPLMKLMNPVMVGQAKRGKGGWTGVLTSVGAKSGQHRQSVLGVFPDGDDAWLIVASFGGSASNPAWYYNLAVHPDQAELEFGGRKVPVTATQLSGAEREAAWQKITTARPQYSGYATKTDREIPILRLTAR